MDEMSEKVQSSEGRVNHWIIMRNKKHFEPKTEGWKKVKICDEIQAQFSDICLEFDLLEI